MKVKRTTKANRVELLAPAGDMEKLKTAFHFGADAVYLAGKQFGLRAYAGNFDTEGIAEAVRYAHNEGKKVYVTVNIYASNADFCQLPDYLRMLDATGVDAVLVSDVGILALIKQIVPTLEIHLSTQANTTNKYAARYWGQQGVKRVVCARETPLSDIKEMIDFCPDVEFETFCHGAMCISYSGRCLLSNYLTNRASNRGECVQACRWKYQVIPDGHDEESLPVREDERGTYIFNSRDLNTLHYLDRLIDTGIKSLKIEGRMKSPYYVATVVNAYHRAIERYYDGCFETKDLEPELLKASHRAYSTGFFFDGDGPEKQYYPCSKAEASAEFIAVVKSYSMGYAIVEMRNRFKVGDTLEILSRGDAFNKILPVGAIVDVNTHEGINVCDKVQQIVKIPCQYPLNEWDILRTHR